MIQDIGMIRTKFADSLPYNFLVLLFCNWLSQFLVWPIPTLALKHNSLDHMDWFYYHFTVVTLNFNQLNNSVYEQLSICLTLPYLCTCLKSGSGFHLATSLCSINWRERWFFMLTITVYHFFFAGFSWKIKFTFVYLPGHLLSNLPF